MAPTTSGGFTSSAIKTFLLSLSLLTVAFVCTANADSQSHGWEIVDGDEELGPAALQTCINNNQDAERVRTTMGT
jgi:hypothetical protein